MSYRDIESISKKKVLYSNENSTDNNRIKNEKNSVKKYNHIYKNNDGLFINKIEKIMTKKGQMTTQNKSNNKINNYSINNSFANFKKKYGCKLYNNYNNINDKSFTNNVSRLRDSNLNDNMDILKKKIK